MSSPPTTPEKFQDLINHDIFENENVVQRYTVDDPKLFAAEETLYRKIASEVRDGAILDLGVGGGRTTPHLLKLSRDYTGVDYSAEMVAACRSRYPGVAFQEGDARELKAFESGRFDLVFFSFNGIDCVGHEDRLKILDEMHRLLKPGGLFWFSTHNLRLRPAKPWHPSVYEWDMHPRSIARNIYYALKNIRNYRSRARAMIEGEDYAVLVDSAHQFRLLLYYITPAEQLRQLSTHGFAPACIVDHEGVERAIDDPSLCHSVHLQYLARKLVEGVQGRTCVSAAPTPLPQREG